MSLFLFISERMTNGCRRKYDEHGNQFKYLTETVRILKDLKRRGFPPLVEDLQGAAVSLVRLVETYHLDVRELKQGNLVGKFYNSHQKGII